MTFGTVELTYRSSGRVRVVRDVCDGDGHGPDDWHGPDDGHGPDHIPGLLGFTGFADNRVETIDRVSRVVDCSHGTVGLHEAVLAADHVASALFRLVFDVAGGGVVHAVLVSVARRDLKNIMFYRMARTRLYYRFGNGNVKLFSMGIGTQKRRRRVVLPASLAIVSRRASVLWANE